LGNFWVAYSDAMIFIAPLVATVVFGKSGDLYAPTLPFYGHVPSYWMAPAPVGS
jgi:hypothetical protein